MLGRPLARQYAQRRTFYKAKQISATQGTVGASNVFTLGRVNKNTKWVGHFAALDGLDDLVAMLCGIAG